MPLKIALLPGDGIGPEVTEEAVRVLKDVADHAGKQFQFSTHSIGGVAIDAHGRGLPEQTLEACLGAKAVLLGAVGHPKFDGRLPSERPEAALLTLRQALGGYANLRPAICYAPLAKRTAFQPERVKGANLLIVRELLGGLYYGEPRGFDASGNTAFNTLIYSRHELARANAARKWRRSTRPTCWKRRGCGAAWYRKSARSIPISSSSTSMWTRPRCGWRPRRPAST